MSEKIKKTESTEQEVIVLKGTFNKTPGQSYKIAPCPNAKGIWPACVRKVDANGDMILSEKDKEDQTKGKIFLPIDEPIIVEHGTTFDLSNDLQRAQWEAIQNSKLIVKERDEMDSNGDYIIDGGKSIIDKYENPRGRYGLAELYIERPGRTAKVKNDIRKLIHQAEDLVINDSLDHRILICRLFEKDMRHANSNDVEDFLLTQAEKYPEKVIKYYNAEESTVRLLLLVAKERNVVSTKQDGLYYAEIKLGANLDFAVEYVKADQALKDAIKSETYPDLEAKKSK